MGLPLVQDLQSIKGFIHLWQLAICIQEKIHADWAAGSHIFYRSSLSNLSFSFQMWYMCAVTLGKFPEYYSRSSIIQTY